MHCNHATCLGERAPHAAVIIALRRLHRQRTTSCHEPQKPLRHDEKHHAEYIQRTDDIHLIVLWGNKLVFTVNGLMVLSVLRWYFTEEMPQF